MLTKLFPDNVQEGDHVTVAFNMERYSGVVHKFVNDHSECYMIVRKYLPEKEAVIQWRLDWDEEEQEFYNKDMFPYRQVFRGTVDYNTTLEDTLMGYRLNSVPLILSDGTIVEDYINKVRWKYGNKEEPPLDTDFVTVVHLPDGTRRNYYAELSKVMESIQTNKKERRP